jgi:hypothetical protein
MTTTTTTIAVAVRGNQFVSVQAVLYAHLGPTPVALHRTVNRAGWTVTSVACGFAMVHGTTRNKALAAYQRVLIDLGPSAVLARVAAEPVAPSPDSLRPAPTKRPKPKAAPANGGNAVAVAYAVAERAHLTVAERDAVLRALCKSGPNAGRLLAQAPARYKDPLAQAAWNGLQPNPYKIQPSCVLWAAPAERALLDKLVPKNWPVWLDSDAHALVDLGVW